MLKGLLAVFLLLSVALACDNGDGSVDVPTRTPGSVERTSEGERVGFGVETELDAGESVVVGDEGVVDLTFIRVTRDSRCPERDCPEAGEAMLQMLMDAPGASGGFDIIVGENGQGSLRFDAYVVTVSQLLPAASATTAIDPMDYVVSLSVTRAESSGPSPAG